MTLSVYERRKLAEIEQQLSSDPSLRMLTTFRLPPPTGPVARPPMPPPPPPPPPPAPRGDPLRRRQPLPRVAARGPQARASTGPPAAPAPPRPRRRDTVLLVLTVVLLVTGPALLVPAFVAGMPWLAVGALVTPAAAALLSVPAARTAATCRGRDRHRKH